MSGIRPNYRQVIPLDDRANQHRSTHGGLRNSYRLLLGLRIFVPSGHRDDARMGLSRCRREYAAEQPSWVPIRIKDYSLRRL